jgi:hypothetical protein
MQRYVRPAQLQIRAPKRLNVATGYNIRAAGAEASPSTDSDKETIDLKLVAITRRLSDSLRRADS